MSRNGAGVFAVLNPILVGALRSSTAVNADFTDAGTDITNTLPLDGTVAMTGQFKAADGSQAMPGMAFASDTRVGFRRTAQGEMRWVSGGVDRLYIDANLKAWQLAAMDVAGAVAAHGAWTGVISDPLLISAFAANGVARRTATTPTWAPDAFNYSLYAMQGGFGTLLPAGIFAEVQAPVDGTLISAALMFDQSGSASVDVRKSAYADYTAAVPGSSESITGGNPLAVTSGLGLLDQTLSGWTTAITAGDVIRFYLTSSSTITRLTVALSIKRFT